MDRWRPAVGDEFQVEIDENNSHNKYALAVKVDSEIIGHVPQDIKKLMHYFIRKMAL